MISNSFMTSTGAKKCMPITRVGSFTAVASVAIGMVEVLLAIVTSGRSTASSCLST